ncbi:hypothetical protein AB0J83_23120 [Actinoplanes sp. NPDC049596]|uniref:hypothetical protein n=1 Tax=unclassified Actinoplanes TaxID=2626549 RepID=UPI0034336548
MLARFAAPALCVVLLAAGCSSGDDDPAPEPTGLIAATTMRGALLQATDIGPTWAAPADAADGKQLVSICGGTTTPPPVPPGSEVVAASFVDEGEKGAQTLDQTALVYGDASAAKAGQAALRAVADGCKADISVPATVTNDKSEPAYTETVEIKTLDESGWSGFAVIRHKKYEPKHPGTADTAVAVLTKSNVVLVDAYAIYQLNNASTSPNFAGDWQKLVGSVVQRVG